MNERSEKVLAAIQKAITVIRTQTRYEELSKDEIQDIQDHLDKWLTDKDLGQNSSVQYDGFVSAFDDLGAITWPWALSTVFSESCMAVRGCVYPLTREHESKRVMRKIEEHFLTNFVRPKTTE